MIEPHKTKRHKTWRCYHCDIVFQNEKAARFHFGDTPCADPACFITDEQLRILTEELARYRNEDTDLHRQIHQMESAHQVAIRRAEESGYAKGLRDAAQIEMKQAPDDHGPLPAMVAIIDKTLATKAPVSRDLIG